MSRRTEDEKFATDVLGCFLFGLGAAVVGTVRLVNDIATPVPSGINVGHYRASLGVRKSVGIPQSERLKHTHILGATGSGKTTLMTNLIVQDIQAGHGLAVIDPKGDLIDGILARVPAHRQDDVVLFDPTDTQNPVGFNVLEFVDEAYRSRTASEVMSIFQKLFGSSWGPRMENILRYTILTLLEVPGSTLLDVPDLLLNADYRLALLTNVENFSVRNYWEHEYTAYSDSQAKQAVMPILNRIGPWMAYPEVRNIIGQLHSSIYLRTIMDTRRILLVNIPQGILGEDTSNLLGAMLVSKLQLTAMARAELPLHKRPEFFLYVDEFQNFVTSSFGKILTEARSFGLGLIVANQFPEQLSRQLTLTLNNNVAVRLVCYPEKNQYRVFYQTPQEPESEGLIIQPLPPASPGNLDVARNIREMCRQRYGRPRRDVEHDILGRYKRRHQTADYAESESFWGE